MTQTFVHFLLLVLCLFAMLATFNCKLPEKEMEGNFVIYIHFSKFIRLSILIVINFQRIKEKSPH
jgi:hypothetical protein